MDMAGSIDYRSTEQRKRASRWRFFQIVFAAVYVGIVLDVVTTALGYRRAGSSYEQNPLGVNLIGHLGWLGMLVLLSAICIVCYHSVRLVYARMALGWSLAINGIMVLIAIFRWLAVVTAIIYLIQG
jgi:hypothetical protein